MSLVANRVLARIQDPKRTTSISRFAPRTAPLFAPAAPGLLHAAEAELGFRLPPLLRELYTKVGNGGYGPGYGIFGLQGGFVEPVISLDGQRGTLLDWYDAYRGADSGMPALGASLDAKVGSTLFIDPEPRPDNWTWFDKLLPICHHGDWQVSCVDCADPGFRVCLYDGQQSQLRLSEAAFDEWLVAWLDDE